MGAHSLVHMATQTHPKSQQTTYRSNLQWMLDWNIWTLPVSKPKLDLYSGRPPKRMSTAFHAKKYGYNTVTNKMRIYYHYCEPLLVAGRNPLYH